MCGIHNWGTKIPNMFTVLRAYIDGTNENGGVYIKGIENIPKHIAYIGVDNLHLLADGYTAIANNLAKYIVGGTIDFYAYGNCTFTPTNGSLTGNPVIATGICNDISYLFIGDIVIVKGSENLSFNRNGEWNDLGTIGKTRTDHYYISANHSENRTGVTECTETYLLYQSSPPDLIRRSCSKCYYLLV